MVIGPYGHGDRTVEAWSWGHRGMVVRDRRGILTRQARTARGFSAPQIPIGGKGHSVNIVQAIQPYNTQGATTKAQNMRCALLGEGVLARSIYVAHTPHKEYDSSQWEGAAAVIS